jgi:hypothetical protein
MEGCSVEGCCNEVVARSLCNAHYKKFRRHGTLQLVNRAHGTGSIHPISGRLYKSHEGKLRLAHLLIAEKALGKPLPEGVQVHHVDEDRLNNDPHNLVICPDQAYHALLHQRADALDACGHVHWRKCKYCKSWDDPQNLRIYSGSVFHFRCEQEYRRQRKAKRDS